MFGGLEDHIPLDAANSVVRTIRDEYLTSIQRRIEYRRLDVVPVFLIDRAVELQTPVHPSRLPADLFVLERVRRIRERHAEDTEERRISGENSGTAIKTTRPEAFGVSRIEQDLIGQFPAEVHLALVSGIALAQTQGIQTLIADAAGARCFTAASVSRIFRAELIGVHPIEART